MNGTVVQWHERDVNQYSSRRALGTQSHGENQVYRENELVDLCEQFHLCRLPTGAALGTASVAGACD